MRVILGRLADLGLRQLLGLLGSSGAEGWLELDTPAGQARLAVRGNEVSGEVAPAVMVACRAKAGAFKFQPHDIGETGAVWREVDEFLIAYDATVIDAENRASRNGAGDPLGELRAELGEVEIESARPEIQVVAADPRPYRALEPEWLAHGWEVRIGSEPVWPGESVPAALIVHLPTSVTLVGQEDAWLELAHEAGRRVPRVPVLWVGGLADPWLRHQAVMAGVDFLLPAPVGEVGETARWFREEITALLDRVVTGRPLGRAAEEEAFRDFFFALHMDATPAEVCASVLRIASGMFRSGVLLAVRDDGFEPVGSYGLGRTPSAPVPRGVASLEQVERRKVPISLDRAGREPELAALFGETVRLDILPALAGPRCVAVLVAGAPLDDRMDASGMRDLLARSGHMLIRSSARSGS